MNDALSVFFQRHVWHARGTRNLWRFVYEQQRLGLERSLEFWEGFAACQGHPTHVMSKSKVGVGSQAALGLGAVCRYSPEFGRSVPLRLLAARRQVMVALPSADGWQHFWSARHPDSVALLAKEVGAAHAGAFLLLWVHPLNEEHLRRAFAGHFRDGSLRILEGCPARGCPTMSFRTLAMAEGYHAKLPVPLQMTSWPRYLSPVEAQESAVISQVLPRLDLPATLVVVPEALTCHASCELTGGAAPYEQARYCSMLVRDSPSAHVRDGHRLVPLAAAFSRAPSGRSLYEEIWVSSGIGRAEILPWFAKYVGIVAGSQIIPYVRYGFTIEAHQQNGMIEIGPGGWPTRLFCREIGGGIEWDLERLRAFPALDFSGRLYPRQDIFTSARTCRNLLRHTMLESHLLPLADVCSASFGIGAESLRAVIRSEVAAVIDTVRPACGDAWSSERFHTYASSLKLTLLESPSCEQKALLRMRLQNTKDYMFFEGRNRLARRAGKLT